MLMLTKSDVVVVTRDARILHVLMYAICVCVRRELDLLESATAANRITPPRNVETPRGLWMAEGGAVAVRKTLNCSVTRFAVD